MRRATPAKLNWPPMQPEPETLLDLVLSDRPRDERPLRGALTTDHPASSYGIPVVVAGGRALGPAECPPIDLYRAEGDYGEGILADVEAAERAGYVVRNAAEVRAFIASIRLSSRPAQLR